MDAAYVCFLLLGMGALLPWNALITAVDYWELRFPGRHTDRLLTVTYLPANLATVSGMLWAHARVRPRLRVTAGLAGLAAALAAVTLMGSPTPGPHALAALLALVALCGGCDGLASGGLYGEAAVLGPRYTQAVAAGNSLSGVAVSALRLATKALLPASAAGLRRSAGLFFTISAAFCCGCVLLYSLVLPRLPAVRRRREEMLQAALQGYEPLPAGDGGGDAGGCAAAPGAPVAELSPATAGLLSGRQSPLPGRHSPLPGKQSPLKLRRRSLDVELSTKDAGFRSLQSSPLPAYRSLQASPLPPQLGLSAVVDEEAVLPGAQQESHAGGSGGSRAAPASLSDVLQRILPLASANALTFIVTLSIFPGVLAEDLFSARLGDWYPVLLIALYNVADWAGKALAGRPALRMTRERTILGAAAARALFVPAFRTAAAAQAAPPAAFLLTATLGASNGFSCACAMMRAPANVPPAAAGLAGNLMVLFLVAGLCLGATASFAWLLFPLHP